jgi:glycine/D-amino acid oxidase-like deaminating enzyme
MHAPAAGEVVAQLICGEPTSVDVSALRFDRFARGALVVEHNVI